MHEASLERVRAIVGADQPLTEADEQLLDTLASQRAIADERAELFRHTTAISEELQYSLAASPLPTLDRFEIAAYYAPGGDDLEHVGGDWYDAVGTWGGGLVLVVGDVMGRGVRAATTMIHVRAGIRGLLTVEPDPAALLEAADQLMARDAPEQFVTAAAVLIDPDAGTLGVCNAGHVPLVLVRPDGTADAGRARRGRAARRAPPAAAAHRARSPWSRAAWSCWSPTGSWSRATATSTRASSGSADGSPSSSTGRWRSWSPGWPRSPTTASRTTSPSSPPGCARTDRSSAAQTSSTAVGAPATYHSTPAAPTLRVTPPAPRMIAAPGSSSHGGTECWHSTCSRPSATAIASIEPEPSIRIVAAPFDHPPERRADLAAEERRVQVRRQAGLGERPVGQSGASGTPSTVDGRSGPPTKVRPVAGWWIAPRTRSSPSVSAIAEHHQSRPARKL